ncbi:MAG: hypothetical protein AAF234_16045 [Pseudomonadota bacterium]
MASTSKDTLIEGVTDRLIQSLSPIARNGNAARLNLSAHEVRLLLQWARTMRGVERSGLNHVKAKQALKAARLRRAKDRAVFWAGFRDRLGDLLIAYALTGITLWIVEAFWLAGGR